MSPPIYMMIMALVVCIVFFFPSVYQTFPYAQQAVLQTRLLQILSPILGGNKAQHQIISFSHCSQHYPQT